MPVYTYKCTECAKKFDRFLKLAQFDEPQSCACGGRAERQVVAPFIRPDYAPYDCPITGKRIEGRKEHEANLAAHGCRLLEPGETSRAAVAAKAEETSLEDKLAESAAEFVATLPPAKQEQLACELSHGLDVEITRI